MKSIKIEEKPVVEEKKNEEVKALEQLNDGSYLIDVAVLGLNLKSEPSKTGSIKSVQVGLKEDGQWVSIGKFFKGLPKHI